MSQDLDTGVAAEAIREALQIEADALAVLAQACQQSAVLEAAQALARASFVTTCASGSSGFAAAKFSHSLCCIERPAKFMSPAEAIHGGLGAIQPDGAVVMVSRGGKTAELLPIIDVVKAKGATLIGLTENTSSTLAEASDIVVPLVVTRESDPLNVMATTSNTVTGVLLDAMLAAVMVLTGYRLEQFALIHPGGAVGARLNPKS